MKVSITTLGCKVNQYESASIAKGLIARGHIVTDQIEPADAYVINTCAVTTEGERKSRGYITKINKINPHAKIYICGCSAENDSLPYVNRPNVKSVVGTAGKMQLVDIIEKDLSGNFKIPPPNIYDDTMQSSPTHARATLKIQDGCNSFCSYCIIPYLRGRSRSRTLESIDAELKTLDTLEIVFAGINMAQYGKDLEPKRSLTDVAKLMTGRQRFRFSSLEMGSITEPLVKQLSKMPNFCPHFHLSMQSGSNTVLKRMNRKHTKEEYIQCIDMIRKYFPNAGITTDIIVGFPNETDAEWNETIETVKRVNFFEIHIFTYSKRPGTLAAKYPILDGKIVKARAKQLEEISKNQKKDFLKSQKGTIQEVLVEEQKGEYYVGHTPNYIYTYIQTNYELPIHKIVKIKIGKPYLDGVIAEEVE